MLGSEDVPKIRRDVGAIDAARYIVEQGGHGSRNAAEPRSIFTSDPVPPHQPELPPADPTSALSSTHEHIYPIMPLLYMPKIQEMVRRSSQPSEKNLIFALSALTCFHMSGKSIQASGPESWEVAGRFFLDECLAIRQSYDFLEDMSLYAVISSFWLSTSFFEINQSRKSWFYLREADPGLGYGPPG